MTARQPGRHRMTSMVRALLAVTGVGCLIMGVVTLAIGGVVALTGLWPLVSGIVILVALAFERRRYRSEAAERTRAPAGPGGGEPNGLPARFQRTDERFVDPTTNLVMRVFVDPATGERRYRAEG